MTPFTAVFGMGTGVASSLWAPGKIDVRNLIVGNVCAWPWVGRVLGVSDTWVA